MLSNLALAGFLLTSGCKRTEELRYPEEVVPQITKCNNNVWDRGEIAMDCGGTCDQKESTHGGCYVPSENYISLSNGTFQFEFVDATAALIGEDTITGYTFEGIFEGGHGAVKLKCPTVEVSKIYYPSENSDTELEVMFNLTNEYRQVTGGSFVFDVVDDELHITICGGEFTPQLGSFTTVSIDNMKINTALFQ